MTSSGNGFFSPLRQHKLFKVKLMPESFGYLHHQTPPFYQNNTCANSLSESRSFPRCAGAATLLWAQPDDWPAPTSGQTEEQRKHKETLLLTTSPPILHNETIPLPLTLSDSFGVTGGRATSGMSSSFLSLCFFGEI